jgi:protoporphyrinogen oxidase
MPTVPHPRRSDEYAILGAGVLGLTAALRLLQRGQRVTVFEREANPGGLAAGFPVEPGSWLEKFYHHIFRSDRAIIGLIRELGLGDDLVWKHPMTVVLVGGDLYQLDSARSLLQFAPLRMRDRVRMGCALAALRGLPSAGPLEGQRAAQWIRRAMGPAAYDVVWGPLLRAKFGDFAEEIAMPWFWARVHDRTAELGYVRRGFQRFYLRLADAVTSRGGRIRLQAEVQRVAQAGEGFRITYRRGRDAPIEQDSFSRVVSTLPTRLTCRLVDDLPEGYRQRYEVTQAFGAHCLLIALDRPLTANYWMNISDPGYPFMVVVEHTNLMDASDYGGRHLVYLGNYKPMDDALFQMRREDVLARFTPHLQRINPAFDPSWIKETWMFAAPYAQPIVSTDYKRQIPPFDTPVRGLFLANMFQVYPHDRGQNYSVQLAERLVRHLEGAPLPLPAGAPLLGSEARTR